MLTLGSLFDGSGTCPLAASAVGITPVWASEVEPFPIAVTSARFPNMKHLGDITKMDGGKIPPVDIITFGSPCQNLSLAGNRTGLAGEQSSLFVEAIRIIKEMREATNGKYPKFALWENVYGAYSSSSGEDFRTVIEMLWQIGEGGSDIPAFTDRSGKIKWPKSGYIVGNHTSLAWRGLDAQFWGVPQRRKRVFVVADFGGQRAGEVLFVRKGLSRDFKESIRAWEGTPGYIEDSVRASGIGFDGYNGTITGDKSSTLGVNCGMSTGRSGIISIENHPTDGRVKIEKDGNVGTLTSRMGTGGNNVPLVMEPITMQIRCGCEGGGKGPLLLYIVRRLTPTECARLQGFPDWWCRNISIENPTEADMNRWREIWDAWCDISGQKRKTDKFIASWLKNPNSDAAEYKMWGNGMAYPCILYIMEGLAEEIMRKEKSND